MLLSVIIVNYKTYELTKKCTESILNTIHDIIDYEIIIIDNASGDSSRNIQNLKPEKIKWIGLNENLGFGRANNVGILTSKGTYILFVNSDIIVLENTIKFCISVLEDNPEIGVLGCKLTYPDGSHQKSVYYEAGSFKSILVNNLFVNYLFGYQAKKMNALMGSFMLIPKTVLEKSGYFDPDFFMYSEEIELCRRIVKCGYQIKFTDQVSAIHFHEGSSNNKKANLRQRFLSNALLYLKLHGLGGYFFYHLLFFLNIFSNFVVMWFISKNYRSEFKKNYFESTYGYFSNFFAYLSIPFYYNNSYGSGKRFLTSGK